MLVLYLKYSRLPDISGKHVEQRNIYVGNRLQKGECAAHEGRRDKTCFNTRNIMLGESTSVSNSYKTNVGITVDKIDLTESES